MRQRMLCIALVLTGFVAAAQDTAPAGDRTLSLKNYRDKMRAGWLGQMAGVGWGDVTEFKYTDKIVPENKMPAWKPSLINQYQQDDIYVEMTFVRTLDDYGLDVSIRQAGIDFANSGYELWHANKFGRKALREGIAPPDSGHPKYNGHADDIDYQIEADYSGLVAPGMPQIAIELGDTFGRLMNYGDGLYGGQFIGAMYSEAFFEKDPETLVVAGLRAIPEGSQYHECISDVLRWFHESPDDWQATWKKVSEKYQHNPEYRRASCKDANPNFNIDAKINGAYVVMGLLYGGGDIEKTATVATRCGQDSDCNPANACGVLFTTIGFDAIPETYKKALKYDVNYSHTAYNFNGIAEACEKIARQAVARCGGGIQKDERGEEYFSIPNKLPVPDALEQCWAPAPPKETKFTAEEMARITAKE